MLKMFLNAVLQSQCSLFFILVNGKSQHLNFGIVLCWRSLCKSFFDLYLKTFFDLGKFFFKKKLANVWTQRIDQEISWAWEQVCHSQLAVHGGHQSTGVYRYSSIGKDSWPLSVHHLVYSLIHHSLPTKDVFAPVDKCQEDEEVAKQAVRVA